MPDEESDAHDASAYLSEADVNPDQLRIRLNASRGAAAVSSDTCTAWLDHLGLDTTSDALRRVGQKRRCLLSALDSAPGYVRAAVAAEAWTGAGLSPVADFLAALPGFSATARPDSFSLPTALPDLVVEGTSFQKASATREPEGESDREVPVLVSPAKRARPNPSDIDPN